MSGNDRIVVVVEDDPGVRATLVDILQEYGHPATPVESVAAARALEPDPRYAVALVDLALPDGSGIDAARDLRLRNPHLDVVFLTANASLQSAIDAVELGAARYLQKPCHPRTVLTVIDEIIERHRLRAEAATQRQRLEVAYDLLSRMVQSLSGPALGQLGADTLAQVTGQGVAMALCDKAFRGIDPSIFTAGELPHATRAHLLDQAWWADLHARCQPGQTLNVGEGLTALCIGRPEGDRLAMGVLALSEPSPEEIDLVRHVARQLASGLHQAALHRRLEVAYQQLQETQATMIEAEKQSAIGRLAAGIAHEIGTPLNIISGRAEVLLGRVDETESALAGGLRTICGQIDRIALLVRQLLDYARADSGDAPVPVRLAAVLAETLPLIETRAMRRTTRIDNHINGDTPLVLGSFQRLQQVMLNLLLNAVDAGAHAIRIEASPDAESPMLTVSITDDGSGISEDKLSQVFEPFYTTKGRGHGTGLGLAVAREIVRELGGELWAESADSGGACLRMRLPLAPRNREEQP